LTGSDDDERKRKLPPWLRDLFTQRIEEFKQYFTISFIKPPSIRAKYLAALQEHSLNPGCITCVITHAFNGEKYCTELEQKLKRARNQHDVRTCLGNQVSVTKQVIYRYRLS